MPNLNYSNYNFDYYQYKKKITAKNKISFSVIFLFIILLSGLFVFLKPIKNNNTIEFNFVEIGCYSSYKQALELANKCQTEGAAGYIYYDSNYHVLANFYLTETDANSVVENLLNDYNNSKVFSIESNNNKSTINNNEDLKNLNTCTINTINNLTNLSIDYDKNELNFNQVKNKLTNLYENFKSSNNSFLAEFKTSFKLNSAKENSSKIEQNLLELSSSNEENFNQLFKYKLIDIVINYSSFLDCF